MVMKKLKFSQVKPGIVNTPGFRSLKEIKQAGYRIVKERPACRTAQRRRQGRVLVLTIIHKGVVPAWLYASGRPPDRHARPLPGSRWR